MEHWILFSRSLFSDHGYVLDLYFDFCWELALEPQPKVLPSTLSKSMHDLDYIHLLISKFSIVKAFQTLNVYADQKIPIVPKREPLQGETSVFCAHLCAKGMSTVNQGTIQLKYWSVTATDTTLLKPIFKMDLHQLIKWLKQVYTLSVVEGLIVQSRKRAYRSDCADCELFCHCIHNWWKS